VARPEAAPSSQQTSAASEAAKRTAAEVAGQGPAHCGFGATRVGALLGRLRLHLQTDRFLAAHRGDAVWEAGCLQAALALAEIVSGMAEGELDAPLPTCRQLPLQTHPSECEGWGTRKTGIATLARCSGELDRGAR
jgi:hypothetical protein